VSTETGAYGRLSWETDAGSFDLVIPGGTIVTTEAQQRVDVGVVDGRIARLGVDLPRGRGRSTRAAIWMLRLAV
jgi:hypothetical protein